MKITSIGMAETIAAAIICPQMNTSLVRNPARPSDIVIISSLWAEVAPYRISFQH